MRAILGVIAIATVAVGLNSCKPQQTETVEEQPSAEMLQSDEYMADGNIEMQNSHVTDTAMWKGKIYTYDITRQPDTLLPKVIEEVSGKPFTDNHIDLKIKVDDKQIFSKRFYKSSFSKCLDKSFMENGVLEGLVYDKAENGKLRFAVSVGLPRSDMYIPMTFTIDANGKMSEVVRDKNLDVEILPYQESGDGV